MLVETLLALTSQISATCIPMGSEPKFDPIPGKFKVVPAREAAQSTLLKRVAGQPLVMLSRSDAVRATGDKALDARHYYLARAGFVADPRATGAVPRGLALSLEVDRNGVAYVTSFILSRQEGTAAIAVVLATERPINRVIAVCGAAE